MKTILASMLGLIIIGLSFAGYLYTLYQSDNVQSALYSWEKENRFAKCSQSNNLTLAQRITLTGSTKTEIDTRIAQTKIEDMFGLAVEYITNKNDLYSKGEGYSVGMYVLHEAALKGDPVAMNEVGASMMYCEQGVAQDLNKAKVWIEKSANLNDEYAQYNLAVIGLMDNGIEIERPVILKSLRKSIRQGNNDSKALLEAISVRARLSAMEKLALELHPKPTKSQDDLIIEALEEYFEENPLSK